MPSLKRSRTYRINSWMYWTQICAELDIDPYETDEIDRYIGGGDTVTYEFIGEKPE